MPCKNTHQLIINYILPHALPILFPPNILLIGITININNTHQSIQQIFLSIFLKPKHIKHLKITTQLSSQQNLNILFLKNCPNLKTLQISFCNLINASIIESLHLQDLTLNNCSFDTHLHFSAPINARSYKFIHQKSHTTSDPITITTNTITRNLIFFGIYINHQQCKKLRKFTFDATNESNINLSSHIFLKTLHICNLSYTKSIHIPNPNLKTLWLNSCAELQTFTITATPNLKLLNTGVSSDLGYESS